MLVQLAFDRLRDLARSTLPSKTYRRRTALVVLMALVVPTSARTQAKDQSACTLSDADVAWIQRALDGWHRVSADVLDLDPQPLPWMVLFNRSCAWHLAPDSARLADAQPADVQLTFAGEAVPVSVKLHDGGVWLPAGTTRPVGPMAFTSSYESESGDQVPFFVLALLDVWRENPRMTERPDLEAIMLGVATHEIVHTRQVTQVARRIEELRDRYTVPESLNDDIVEDRFKDMPGFRDAHEAETDLLYRAASEVDPVRKRTLVAEALAMIRARQARYFTGDDAVYMELEGLFLNMEGVAVWASLKLSQMEPAYNIGIEDPAADRGRNSWTQDQGRALFLLIDELVPNWLPRVLGSELASPYQLLEESVTRR